MGTKANNMTELVGDFFNNIESKPEIEDKNEYINAIQNSNSWSYNTIWTF